MLGVYVYIQGGDRAFQPVFKVVCFTESPAESSS